MSNDYDGPSIDEYGTPFSEAELSQIENDASAKSKIKICPICNTDFIDNSYWGECTCGNKFCEEEYQKIHGRKNKKRTNKFYEDDKTFFSRLKKASASGLRTMHEPWRKRSKKENE